MIEVTTSSMKRGTVLPNFGGKYQLFDCNDFAMEDGEKNVNAKTCSFILNIVFKYKMVKDCLK